DGVIRVLPFADNLPACLFQQLGGGGGGASGGVVGVHRDTSVGLVDDLAEAVDGSFLVIAVAVSGHLPLENGYNAVVAHHDVCRGGDGGNVAVRVGSRAPIGVDLVELGHDLAQINLGDNGGDVQPAVRGDRVPCPLGRVKLGRSEKLAAGQDDTGRECVVNGVPVLLNDVLQNAVFLKLLGPVRVRRREEPKHGLPHRAGLVVDNVRPMTVSSSRHPNVLRSVNPAI